MSTSSFDQFLLDADTTSQEFTNLISAIDFTSTEFDEACKELADMSKIATTHAVRTSTLVANGAKFLGKFYEVLQGTITGDQREDLIGGLVVLLTAYTGGRYLSGDLGVRIRSRTTTTSAAATFIKDVLGQNLDNADLLGIQLVLLAMSAKSIGFKAMRDIGCLVLDTLEREPNEEDARLFLETLRNQTTTVSVAVKNLRERRKELVNAFLHIVTKLEVKLDELEGPKALTSQEGIRHLIGSSFLLDVFIFQNSETPVEIE